MTKIEVQRSVRQRARFSCELHQPKELLLAQYAHIVPGSHDGLYQLDNLLWLCESCHRRFESQNTKGRLQIMLQSRMREIRDKPKLDSLIEGVIDELSADPDTDATVKMGSVRFENVVRLFSEPLYDRVKPSYLSIVKRVNHLRLDGLLKDIDGKPLIEFYGDKLHLYTGDFWDIERRARYLKITSASRRIWFELAQEDDLAIKLEGEIFAGGSMLRFTDVGLQFSGMVLKGIGMRNFGTGLVLPKPPGYQSIFS